MKVFLTRLASATAVAGVALAGLTSVLAMSAPRNYAAGPVRDTAATLRPLLGLSGQLRAVALRPDAPEPAPLAALAPALARAEPGVHSTGLTAPDGESIQLLAFLPLSAKRGATWNGYRVGFWPGERSARARYPLPDGFLAVTPADEDRRLSAHFRLGDFLTHGQDDVWPKLLVIRLPLVDKLELIRERLRQLGRPAALRVMSGFRTPAYNALGVGRLGGRARNSRHMYGDAADIFVDADGDGRMDDLDHDGRVTVRDARWLADVASQVEARYPSLVGGIGVYHATGAHGPFVHVDVRGTRARW